jgi:hypothetical protein
LTADASGNVSGAFTIPAGTPVGAHTIVLDGSNPQSVARTVTLNVTVAAGSGGVTPTVPGSGTSPGTSPGGGGLAFTGTATRNLVSVALLLVAAGLFLLGQASRRRAAHQP